MVFDFIKKHINKVSIFNEINNFWENDIFNSKYKETKKFLHEDEGCDSELNYYNKGNKKYKEDQILYHLDKFDFRISNKECRLDNKEVVACFGCSQTLGVGLPWEETWPFILNNLFEDKLCVKNYGSDGASINKITRLIYNYIKNYSPKAILCLLPDIFRKEFIKTKLSLSIQLEQYINDKNLIDILNNKKLNSDELDFISLNRFSDINNSVYNFLKDLKFLELISQTYNLPILIFSWDPFLIESFYKKKIYSKLICIPNKTEYEYLIDYTNSEKARDNVHLGFKSNKLFSNIFYRSLVEKIR